VHTPGTGPFAEPAAWLWLAVYVVVPVAMTVVLPRQPHVAGRAHGRAPVAPLPRALTAALLAEGAVLAAVGVALVVQCLSSHGMPAGHGAHAMQPHASMATHAEALWPWTLSPLGAGAIAAWMLAFAVAVVLCVADGDLARLRIATCVYTAFGALQLLTVVRFRDDVAWSRPSAWIFVVMAAAVTATGAAGRLSASRSARLLTAPS
jgi:hypothetical protein